MLQIPKTYQDILSEEIKKDYFKKIISFLDSEKKSWKIIYPEEKNIFNALKLTNFEDVKVVILGQDPYHWEWQAHGLSFSVPEWIKPPPSLKNIFKEIQSDIWEHKISGWNLANWAKQWVLLLNAVLSVEKGKAASHSKIWWQNFTDEIIKQISDKKENVVFLLWWAFAQSKENLIDNSKHLVLKTTHPSPFSAYRWFLWSKHFSKTNNYLEKKWIKKIVW